MDAILAAASTPAESSTDDIFAAAFAQLTEPEATAATTSTTASVSAAENPVTTQTEVKPAETAAATDPAALPPTAEEQAALDAAAAAKVTPAETTQAAPAVSDDDMLRRLGSLIARTETPAEEVQTQQTQQQQTPQYSQEEMGILQGYLNDYPDIERANAIMRRGEYVHVVNHVFNQVRAMLDPMADQLRTLSERTHLGDIKTAVPDYTATTREQVVAWAAKQPAYLKVAYEHVINHGTVDDVKDLITRYKAENPGQVTQAQPAATTQQAVTTASAKPPVKELSPAAQRAVAALAPVQSKRTGATVQAGVDPNNFDDAFASYAKEL